MRVAKLFAYLGLAIFLPVWLFYLSDHELKESEKKKAPEQINITGGHLDTLFAFVAKANSSHNTKLEGSLQNLINVSSANATTIQSLLSRDQDINSAANPKGFKTSPGSYNDIPIYNLDKGGPFGLWRIMLPPLPQNYKARYLLGFNNSSKVDTVFINKISTSNGFSPQFLFPDSNSIHYILPQNQLVIEFEFNDLTDKLFYVIGGFRKSEISFKIPLIIERGR